MGFFDLLTMTGGLALFLYGMELMGESLSRAAGGRLEGILKKLTDSPLKAVLAGAGATAVIQSSSAATVMVVGFVNSGLMGLRQAAWIIMGANIGTTATSWILSLTAVESGGFLLRLLRPASFSPVFAITGVGITLFSRNDRLKNAASVMLGFAILMFGMETMSTAAAPLKGMPGFTSILTRFSDPLFGLLAGLLLTAAVQSSSASVGILQALSATGAVSYAAAVPILMGQNIGTCVTALLSSVGASPNAKRAALIHLYFNVIGTGLFLTVFYALHGLFDFSFMREPAAARGIALLHSAFNIAATAVLLPFSDALVRLACLTVREKPCQSA